MIKHLAQQSPGLNRVSNTMRLSAIWLSIFVVFQTTPLWGRNAISEDPVARLLELHDHLMQASSDTELRIAHEALKEGMRQAWNNADFWACDWSALSERMGVITAGEEEQSVAIITWNLELQNRTQEYGGFVLAKDRNGEPIVIELSHRKSHINRQALDTKKRFKAETWPGAVYYSIIPQTQGKKLVFTLLGWDGADGIRSRKVVETLSIQNGKLRFGVPIIDLGHGSEKRLVLEYADGVTAMLRWREDLRMIVMDHLSAPEPQLQGNTSFYGPDMTYDALVWQKNHWVLKENLEIRDPDMKKPWNNPKRSRRRN